MAKFLLFILFSEVKTVEVNKVETDDGPIDIGRIDLRIGKIVAGTNNEQLTVQKRIIVFV
jgi:hypothetical protein